MTELHECSVLCRYSLRQPTEDPRQVAACGGVTEEEEGFSDGQQFTTT